MKNIYFLTLTALMYSANGICMEGSDKVESDQADKLFTELSQLKVVDRKVLLSRLKEFDKKERDKKESPFARLQKESDFLKNELLGKKKSRHKTPKVEEKTEEKEEQQDEEKKQ